MVYMWISLSVETTSHALLLEMVSLHFNYIHKGFQLKTIKM